MAPRLIVDYFLSGRKKFRIFESRVRSLLAKASLPVWGVLEVRLSCAMHDLHLSDQRLPSTLQVVASDSGRITHLLSDLFSKCVSARREL